MKALLQFLTLDFPRPRKQRIGFLEICNQRHRETVNSAVYGHFLSQDREEQIAELFKNALLSVIESKVKETQNMTARSEAKQTEFEVPAIEDFQVELEVQTEKGNRIDLVLTDQKNDSAIIIENKIYHHVANDLDDYWNSIKSKNKIGVLLTLSKEAIPEGLHHAFVNILHKEWLEAIKQTGLPLDLDTRNYVYLNDFFYSIMELSNTNEMNEQCAFFFQHQHKILQAKGLFNEAYNHIQNSIKAVVEKRGFDTYGKNSRWIQMWPKGQKTEIYFTLVFEQLIEPNEGERASLLFIIEIAKDALNHIPKFDQLVTENPSFHHLNIKTHESKGNWMHYATKTYFPNFDEIAKLDQFIDDRLEFDFMPLFNEMLKTYPKQM